MNTHYSRLTEAVLTSTYNLCFDKIYKKYHFFFFFFFFFFVKFSIYLNRRVFIMTRKETPNNVARKIFKIVSGPARWNVGLQELEIS